MFLALLLLPACREADEEPVDREAVPRFIQIAEGDTAFVRWAGAQPHYLAADAEAFTAMLRAYNQRDADALEALRQDARLFAVPNGSPVRIEEIEYPRAEVVLLGDTLAGRHGWTTVDYLQAQP